MTTFIPFYLIIKDDSRSKVESNGTTLRKTCYSLEGGEREAAITRLAHSLCPDTVVELRDYRKGEEGEVIMEFPHYKDSLGSLLKRREQFPPAELSALVFDLANTVLFLHKHQIAHRDLNLSNVVVDFDTNHILIIDFETSSTPDYPNHDCLSTLDSASPELLRDIESDCAITFTDGYKNDLWALGKLVYDLVMRDRTKSMAKLTRELVRRRVIEATRECKELRPVLETCLEVDYRVRGNELEAALEALQGVERRFPLRGVEKSIYKPVNKRHEKVSGVCPDV